MLSREGEAAVPSHDPRLYRFPSDVFIQQQVVCFCPSALCVRHQPMPQSILSAGFFS